MSHSLEMKIRANQSWIFKSENYSLSAQSVSNNFRVFWENGTLCDVDLITGDTVVKAHRVVLAAACGYFKTMFTSGFVECNNKSVSLPSLPPEVLPLVVEYIYTGQTTISSSTVQYLVDAANMLQLGELIAGCVDYLRKHLHPSNVLGIISFAETHSLVQLAEEAVIYARENWKAVVDEGEFLDLPSPLLVRLLSSDYLAVEDEVQVLHAVLNWLNHAQESRKRYCKEVLQHIRLCKVSPQALENALENVRDTSIAEDLTWLEVALFAVNREPRLNTQHCLYVVGGSRSLERNSALCTAVKFDGKIWKQISPMSVPRYHLGVAALGGRVYAVGGRDGDDKLLASGEVYDPCSDRWTPIAPMETARCAFGLAAVHGKLYAFGGVSDKERELSVEVYDPATEEWTAARDMPKPRSWMSVVTYSGAVYVVGAYTPARGYTDDVLEYHPERAEWRFMRPLRPGRDSSIVRDASVAVYNRSLYAMGGKVTGSTPVNTVACYNLETEETHLLSEMSVPRAGSVAGVVNGVLVVAGGRSGYKVYTDSVELYDLAKDEWSAGPPLPEARLYAGAAVL